MRAIEEGRRVVNHVGWRDGGFKAREETRAQAAQAKRGLVERMRRSSQPEPPPAPTKFAHIPRDEIERAGDQLRFRLLNDADGDAKVGDPVPLNPSTRVLLSGVFDALADRRSTAVLQWPSGQRDVLLLHPLAMLMLIGSSPDQLERDQIWCDPVHSFRSLYFPWRGGSTGSTQRSMLVDRNAVLKRNAKHLTRRVLHKPEASDAMGKLHETIGHLSNLSERDQTQPHLAYPTLAEMYPVFVADGGDDAPPLFATCVGELYGRVRHGAKIDRLSDHRPVLSDPMQAPFGVFGVTMRADLKKAMAHAALKTLDVCLLDLGPPALSRLGHGWAEQVESFIQATRKRFPLLPVFAVTQDGYVHRQVLRMLEPVRATRADAGRPASKVLLRTTEDALTPEARAGGDLTALKAVVTSAGGMPTAALAAMSAAARGLSDSSVAGRIRRAMGGLRRAASLPCGLGPAHSSLEDLEGQNAAEAFLERRSGAGVLAPILEALDGPNTPGERERLQDAEAKVRAAYNGLEGETPVGSLLLEQAVNLSRKSTPSLFVFGTGAERKLAECRWASDPKHGETLGEKIASGKLRLIAADDLEAVLEQISSARDRKSWKRLVLVAPILDRLSSLLIRPWLPEEVVLICDHDMAGRIAATYGALAKHPDIQAHSALAQRLQALAAEAKREAEARDVGVVDLAVEPMPTIVDTDEVIDLVDDDEGSRAVLTLSLQSGRSLRIRPGSVVVKYRRDAETNAFDRETARDVEIGEVIVVPDRAFVEEARRVLPVEVLALSRVAMFHALVEAALDDIPGTTLAAKARVVSQRMQALGVRVAGPASIVDWLRVAEHQKVAPEKRRPHAPQSRPEFRAFMEVLGAGPLAEKVWGEGVQPMRVARRQAGLKMAQAFISVLVDPHGAGMGLDGAVRGKIAVLRQRALDHLDTVTAKTTDERTASA